MLYTQHQRRLAEPQKDGLAYREHLKAVAARSAWARAQLAGPELPPEMAYIWEWFLELNDARTWSETGPNPLTFAELSAWASLTHTHVASWEVKVLRAIDAAWMKKPDGILGDSES